MLGQFCAMLPFGMLFLLVFDHCRRLMRIFSSWVQVHEALWILSLASPFPAANIWEKLKPHFFRALLFQ